MKRYIITFSDKHELEIWASNAHNAEQIAIGVCAKTSGKPQSEIAGQIIGVELATAYPTPNTQKLYENNKASKRDWPLRHQHGQGLSGNSCAAGYRIS